MKVFLKSVLAVFIVGLILIGIGFATGASFSSINDVFTDTSQYVEYNEVISEPFEKVSIQTQAKNIEIRPTDELLPMLHYHLKESETMAFSVSPTKELTIKITTTQKWFNYVSIGIPSPKLITVYLYLPTTFSGAVNAKTSSGNINVRGTYAATTINVSSGNITLKGNYDSVTANAISGNVTVNDATINNDLTLTAQSGNISVTNSIVTGALDVNLSSGNNTIAHVSASSYRVQTTSGNNYITLDQPEQDYEYQLRVTSGTIFVNGRKKAQEYQAGSGILVFAKATSGNIKITTN